MNAVIDAARARPLWESFYNLLSSGAPNTPEGRAQLRRRLEEGADRIGDKRLRYEYKRVLLDRFFEQRRAKTKRPPVAPPRRMLTAEFGRGERMRHLVVILLHHPNLLPDVEEALARLDLPYPLDRLRETMHNWFEVALALDSATLLSHLEASGLAEEAARVSSSSLGVLPQCIRPAVMPAEAAEEWWSLFQLLRVPDLKEEAKAVERTFNLEPAIAQRKLIAIGEERLRAVAAGFMDDEE